MSQQRTPEWFQARLGKLTASRMADATARTKSGYSASRANLMATLICERLTGVTQETYSNSAMQWGTETEPQARAMYEFMRDCDVEEVGFLEHPKIAMSGASPDGHIGADGSLEIKCPGSAVHIQSLLGASIDGKYLKQMQWQLACSGRQWCDFVSFDPRLVPEMQIHISRVNRDPVMITELENEARLFLHELDAMIAKLIAKYRSAEAAE